MSAWTVSLVNVDADGTRAFFLPAASDMASPGQRLVGQKCEATGARVLRE